MTDIIIKINLDLLNKVLEKEHNCLCVPQHIKKLCPCEEIFNILYNGEHCKCGVFTRVINE